MTEPSRSSVRKAAILCFGILAAGLIGYSEWSRLEIGRESAEKSREIWNAFTLVDTAEADYQQAQWNESANVEEVADRVRGFARSFGELRSFEERSAVQNLNLFIARRARVPRQSQSALTDSVFKEQMDLLRTAIEKTDQLERRRVEVDMAQARASMITRLFVLLLLLAAFFGLHRYFFGRRSSGPRRRRSEVKRFRVQ